MVSVSPEKGKKPGSYPTRTLCHQVEKDLFLSAQKQPKMAPKQTKQTHTQNPKFIIIIFF